MARSQVPTFTSAELQNVTDLTDIFVYKYWKVRFQVLNVGVKNLGKLKILQIQAFFAKPMQHFCV